MKGKILTIAMALIVLQSLFYIGYAQIPAPSLNVLVTNYDPFPAEPGQYLDVWIKVINVGNAKADNLTCKFVDFFPFYLKPGEERVKSFGELWPGEEVTMRYKVIVDENALNGENELKIKCTSSGRVWVLEKLKIYVSAEEPKFAVIKLYTEPAKLVSDSEENKLSVEITNLGDAVAKAAVAKLYLPNGFSPSYTYSNIAGLGDLMPGAMNIAVFYIDVDKNVKPGIYKANLTITYFKQTSSNPVKKEITLPLDIEIIKTPKIVLSNYTVSCEKRNCIVKLVFRNEGERKAESASVRIIKNAYIPLDFNEKYAYLGTIEPNKKATAAFEFSIDENALPNTYQVKAEVRYLLDENVKTKDFYFNVKVNEQEEKINMTYVILGTIFVLVIVILAVRLRK